MNKSGRVASMRLSLIVLGVTLVTVGFAVSSDILDFKVVSHECR